VRRSGVLEHKDDPDLTKYCTVTEVERIRWAHPKNTCWSDVKEHMRSFCLFQDDVQIWRNQRKKIKKETVNQVHIENER